MTNQETSSSPNPVLGDPEKLTIIKLLTLQLEELGFKQNAINSLLAHINTQEQALLMQKLCGSLVEQTKSSELVAAVKVIAEQVPTLSQALTLFLGDLSPVIAEYLQSKRLAGNPRQISTSEILELRKLSFSELLTLPGDMFIFVENGIFYASWTVIDICIQKMVTVSDCVALARKLIEVNEQQKLENAAGHVLRTLTPQDLARPFFLMLADKKPEIAKLLPNDFHASKDPDLATLISTIENCKQ